MADKKEKKILFAIIPLLKRLKRGENVEIEEVEDAWTKDILAGMNDPEKKTGFLVEESLDARRLSCEIKERAAERERKRQEEKARMMEEALNSLMGG